MKPVNQKIVSSKNGDCLGACIASLLEITDSEHFPSDKGGPQLDFWNGWLASRNLQLITYPVGSFPIPVGYSILSVKSALFEGGSHAVVFHSGDGYFGSIVHNPNPQDPRGINIPNDDWLRFTVLALVDPARGESNNAN